MVGDLRTTELLVDCSKGEICHRQSILPWLSLKRIGQKSVSLNSWPQVSRRTWMAIQLSLADELINIF